MASPTAAAHPRTKVVVVMGTTGSGKSRLSIDLASSIPSEIINCDKMQIYPGLDLTTNKIKPVDRRNIRHHLLGSYDRDNGEMTPLEFRSLGEATISNIASRGKLPILVGGSNSFIHALLVQQFDLKEDVFGWLSSPASTKLRYDCCFLWVYVLPRVLEQHLSKRVDEMVDTGTFEELAQYYNLGRTETGLRKAIGVPEFDRYFNEYPPPKGVDLDEEWQREEGRERENNPVRQRAYTEVVCKIKENAHKLAKRQMEKIQLLIERGWKVTRLDTTEVVRLAMAAEEEGGGGLDVWNRKVVGPSVKKVMWFLRET